MFKTNIFLFFIFFSDGQARPERLLNRLRPVSIEDTGPRVIVIRQPKGPDGSSGFTHHERIVRLPGCITE